MPPSRPTLRSLAAEAGVSPMTVSLALRNSPGVSAATRARIQQLATEREYRPDPIVTKLMYHLRSHRPTRFHASICGLAERWPTGNEVRHIFTERLLTGLRERCATLGYAFSLVYFDEAGGSRQLQRMLLSRGIEGLVILPLLQPRDLDPLLDWQLFSTVAVTSSVIAPRFHTVVPQHFENMLLACRQLTADGFRRIGLVLPMDWDLRVNHRWTGAITWHNLFGGTESVLPFIGKVHGPTLNLADLQHWLREQRPDVVLCDDMGMANLQDAVHALPAGRRPLIATLNLSAVRGVVGIDQRVETIGAAAIDMLAGMIVHSEKGIPAAPYTTMVLGTWMPHAVPSRPASAGRPARKSRPSPAGSRKA